MSSYQPSPCSPRSARAPLLNWQVHHRTVPASSCGVRHLSEFLLVCLLAAALLVPVLSPSSVNAATLGNDVDSLVVESELRLAADVGGDGNSNGGGESSPSWLSQWIGLFVVGALWGCTNPLLRRASLGISSSTTTTTTTTTTTPGSTSSESSSESSGATGTPLRSGGLLAEITYLLSRWQYVLPFLINQSGSLMFYLLLSQSDVSLVVPVANSLTFLFTTLTGAALGEPFGGIGTLLGIACIVGGVAITMQAELN